MWPTGASTWRPLPVIRVAGVTESARAADQLARSGAFGLVVIDLGECLDLPIAVQTRLAEHALTHGTLILCLTIKTDRQPSLGSLVSVRGQSRRARHGKGRFACQVHVPQGQASWSRMGGRGMVPWTGWPALTSRRFRSSSC